MEDYVTLRNPDDHEMLFAIPASQWNDGKPFFLRPDVDPSAVDLNTEWWVDDPQFAISNPFYGWEKIADGAPQENEDVMVDGVWDNLPGAKARLRDTVNFIRDSLQTDLAPTPIGQVQIDEKSKTKIDGLSLMATLAKMHSEPFGVNFTRADNERIPVDADAMIALGKAVGQFVVEVHDHASDLKGAIEAATDIAELNAIDIHEGWPDAN